jgi:hypothetical protein
MSDIDISKIKPGDKVTLTHADGGTATVLVRDIANHWVDVGGVPTAFDTRVWSITAHEPKVVLPTEPGLYLDKDGEPWRLSDHGLWRYLLEVEGDLDVYPENYAPFTRLEPRADVAKAVLEAVRETADRKVEPGAFTAYNLTEYELRHVGNEFGVQS